MKKLFLMTALVVFGYTANAQDENTDSSSGFAIGDFTLGGGLSFGSESTGDVKFNQFTFSPSVGYFVSDNIAVGIDLGLSTAKDEDGGGETKYNSLTAGAFGQYYFNPANQFSMFLELGAGFSSSKIEEGSMESKSNGFYIGFAPGISYFVSDCLALQAKVGVLGYSTDKPDFDGAESTDTFNLGVDLSDVTFSIIYKL